MAGPYENLFTGPARSISSRAAVGAFRILPVPSSVARRRRRRTAMTIARVPPAIAVQMNAAGIRWIPTTAPTAAINFTSPMPVAPRNRPGSINATPANQPSSEETSVMPLAPIAASTRPRAAVPNVITFGIRRVRRSIAAPAPAPAATATNMTSDGASNGLPEHGVNRASDGSNRRERHQRDEGDEQGVFEQVLPALFTRLTAEPESNQCTSQGAHSNSVHKPAEGRPGTATGRPPGQLRNAA